MVLTCGDIDHDADLDVFIGQYRTPDLGQILRPYYYDANDSFPSYLLLNDGHGNFTNVTQAAGLGPKAGAGFTVRRWPTWMVTAILI